MAAETLGSVLIEVKANLAEFEKDIADVKAQVKTIDGSTAEAIVNVETSQGMAAVDAMEKDLAGIADESVMVTADNQVSAVAEQVSSDVQGLPDGEVMISADTAGLDGVESKIGALPDSHDVQISADTAGLDDVRGKLSGLPDSHGVQVNVDTSEIDKAESKIDGLTAAVGAIGAGAGAAGAIGAFTSMEDAVARVTAATQGLSDVNADLGTVVTNVWQGAFGESVAEVGDAVGLVAAGLGRFTDGSTGEIQKLTEKAFTLADVFQVDMSESIGAVQAMLTHGLAPDATAAFDLIAGGVSKLSGPARDELISAINEYSIHFANLGMGGADAMSLLSNAVGAGNIAVDKAADAIKEFGIRAIDGSKGTAGAFEEIGLDAREMGEAIAAGGPKAQITMRKIAEAILDVEDPIIRNQAAVALFGTQIEDLGGASGLNDLLSAITKESDLFTGSLDQAGETAYDTFGTQMTEAVRAFTAALGELGSMVAPVLEPLVGFFMALPGPLQAVIVAVPILLGIFAALGAILPLIATGLGFIGIGGTTAAAGTTAAGVAAAGSSVGFFAAAAGIWAMMAPLLPIVAAIAAVIAIGVLLWKNWDTIKDAGTAAWGAITDAIKAAVGFITDLFSTLVRVGFAILTGGMTELVGFVVGNFDKIGATVDAVFSWITETIGAAWDWITDKFKTGVDWIMGIPDMIGGAFSKIGELITAPFRAALSGFKSIWNSTLGGKGFSIPDWVPLIGGKSFTIPMLAEGGDITGSGFAMVGEQGPELLWLGQGARVAPLDSGGSSVPLAYSPTYQVTINGDLDSRQERRLADLLDSHDRDLVEMIRGGVR